MYSTNENGTVKISELRSKVAVKLGIAPENVVHLDKSLGLQSVNFLIHDGCKSYFCKTASSSTSKGAIRREHDFLALWDDSIQKGVIPSVPEFRVPKLIPGFQDEDNYEFLVMENLSEEGFEPLTHERGYRCVDIYPLQLVLAQFHAFSYKLLPKFKEIFRDVESEITEILSTEEAEILSSKEVIELYLKVAASGMECENEFIPILQLKNWMNDKYFNKNVVIEDQFQTIVHGESWIQNFMVKYLPGGVGVEKIALVDFAGVRISSPLIDHQRLIYTSLLSQEISFGIACETKHLENPEPFDLIPMVINLCPYKDFMKKVLSEEDKSLFLPFSKDVLIYGIAKTLLYHIIGMTYGKKNNNESLLELHRDRLAACVKMMVYLIEPEHPCFQAMSEEVIKKYQGFGLSR